MVKGIQRLIFIGLVILGLFHGCATIEKSDVPEQNITVAESIINYPSPDERYGAYTSDIEALLNATPIGSEIYLKEGDNGEWYLKIEKIFTSENIAQEAAEYFQGEETSPRDSLKHEEVITI